MVSVAIAAPMWIRTKEEGVLVTKTIQAWTNLSVPIILVDAGSPRENLDEIKNLLHVHVYESNRPFAGQIQLALQKASLQADTVFFCQSDKIEFAKNTLKPMLEAYEKLKGKGVFIATRNKESFATYPFFQRNQETFLNQTVANFTQKFCDYLAGPKLFPAKLMQYLPFIKGEIGWGIELFLTIAAYRHTMPIDFFEFFMNAPTDIGSQKDIEKYRIKITQWELEGLLQGLAVPLLK